MKYITLSLGTNIGKREKNLEEAKRLLKEQGIIILQQSNVYETEAFGYADQDFFLNQVLIVKTNETPEQVLKTCLVIENRMGRKRAGKFGPRKIDIDLLFYNNVILNTKPLTLPHPGIPKRRFVLVPLVELVPKEQHPVLKKTMQQLLDECQDNLIVEAYSL
jgi:2-amino-4-hydroxy-6-hydroxymethyldihydropteridine diphosphokinase